MEAKFIEHNVIKRVFKGPFGLDPNDEWGDKTIIQCYNARYPDTTAIANTTGSPKKNVIADWGSYYYIIGRAK
jgi:hypothetical protein